MEHLECPTDELELGTDTIVTANAAGGLTAGTMGHDTIIGGEGADVLMGDVPSNENLITNGSFENHPDLPNKGRFEWGAFDEIEGWTATKGTQFEVQKKVGTAADGTAVLELDGDANSGIVQILNGLEPEQKYEISFEYSARPGTKADSNIVEVYWAGKLLDTISRDGKGKDFDWQTKTYTVSAPASGEAALSFVAIGASDGLGGIIDSVSVTGSPEAVDAAEGGNDLIRAGEGDDEIHANGGRDFIEGGEGADYIDGGEGSDNALYINSNKAVKIDLEKGKASGGDAKGDVLVNIENLHGSAHNDHLTGDKNDNRLIGRDGNDHLKGGEGDDVLIGGAGADKLDGGKGANDTLEYDWSSTGVDVNLETGRGSGGNAEGDQIKNIEHVRGSYQGDTITGDSGRNRLTGDRGDDTLNGGGGNDVLIGGKGADVLNGGSGTDTADYQLAHSAVVVDLENGGTEGEAAGDTFVGIEFVSGSRYADTITGDAKNNRLMGNDGDDKLFGGAGKDTLIGGEGADALDGGAGSADIASYQYASSGVSLSLANGGYSGEAEGDTFTNIELVYGSQYADKIEGDAGRNRLVGFDGDDVLYGGGNNDTLLGGKGDDTLNGGDGYDVFLMEAAFGNDVIEDFWAGSGLTDRIWFKGLGVSYEDLEFSDTNDGALVQAGELGTLLLEGVEVQDLFQDDFLF